MIGPTSQRLASMKYIDELVRHIVSKRLVLIQYDVDTGAPEFRASLIRSRLFSHNKATPLQKFGDDDATTNSSLLIENGMF